MSVHETASEEPGFILDVHLAEELGVPSQVHPDDFLYRHMLEHPHVGPAVTQEYLRSARESAMRLAEIIDYHFGPAGIGRQERSPRTLLDFASGYGMVARHFSPVMPDTEVTVCDIHPEAVKFCRDVLGLSAIQSSEAPEGLILPHKFNVIFALSFFSHMPATSWERWFWRLSSALENGGLLIFTCHGPASALAAGRHRTGADFSFLSQSEQMDLDVELYGTTYVHPRFVNAVLARSVELHLCEYRVGAWWNGNQDVYVVAKNP